MEIARTCDHCGSEYTAWRRDQRFCTRKCKEQFRNDRKPRISSKSYRAAEQVRSRPISNTALQVVYGGLLGDGCLIKNTNSYRYSLCHSDKQLGYLEWKRSLLGALIQSKAPAKSFNPNGNHIQYHYHSIAHPELEEVRTLCYPNGKKQTSNEWLAKVDALGLCVWYLDDGSFNHNPNSRQITIATESFGQDGTSLLIEWLLDRWGVKSRITKVHTATTYSPARDRIRLTINRTQVESFVSIFKEIVPDCMRYKLP
jgi:hypothetical protein